MNKLYLISFLLVMILFHLSYGTDWQAFMIETPRSTFPVQLEQSAEYQAGKSAKTGFLLSAVVPGAGQYYSGSLWKAAGFFAVEALAWTAYITYNGKGNDIEEEFQSYADQYWIETDYWQWIAQHSGIAYSEENMEALRAWEHDNFSHGLHRQKDQQYYEMIGKYDQFNYGWVDSEIALLDDGWNQNLRSEKRLYYEGRRDASNKAFKNATTGATIALINHILSAMEAAWSISRDNKHIVQTSFHLNTIQNNDKSYPVLSLRVDW